MAQVGKLFRAGMPKTPGVVGAIAASSTPISPKSPSISWTAWVDMTPQPLIIPYSGPAAKPPAARADSEPICLALLAELETSLRSSQAALLARDVARIEQLTSEQAKLQRLLLEFFPPSESRGSGGVRVLRGAWGDQLQGALMRMRHLARVQTALLRRAERSLRAVSHLVAEPQAGYGTVAQGQKSVVRPCPNSGEV